MAENDIKKRAKKEQNRIKRLLEAAGIREETKKLLEPVVANTAWMKTKLDDARELVGEEAITVEYDNGGGQSGIRENPNIKAYEALWKSYMIGIQRIADAMAKAAPTDSPAKNEPEKSMLQLIREKHAKEA